MVLKQFGAVVCSIALLSGCNTAAKESAQPSKQAEAKDAAAPETSRDEMTLSGRAEPYQQTIVSPSIDGKIKNIRVEVGAYVKKGHVLAELDEGDLAVQIKKAEDQIKVVEAEGNLQAMEQQIILNQTMASLNQAMVSLNTMLPPESPVLPETPELSGFPALEEAKSAVKDAELTLSEANKNWADTKTLFENGIASQQELNEAETAKTAAENGLERAKKQVETETAKADIQKKYEQEKAKYKQEKAKYDEEKKKYEREKEKYDAEANQAANQTDTSAQDTIKLQKESSRVTEQMTKIAVEEAKVQLEAIRSQYKYLSLAAPIDGFITEKKAVVGDFVSSKNSLFMITNLDKLYINVNVPESMINRWQENQSVKVEIPTQGIKTDGKVVYIGLLPNEGEQTYPVKVLIDNKDHKIKGGMKAIVTWTAGN